jgi:hypothetical protein
LQWEDFSDILCGNSPVGEDGLREKDASGIQLAMALIELITGL